MINEVVEFLAGNIAQAILALISTAFLFWEFQNRKALLDEIQAVKSPIKQYNDTTNKSLSRINKLNVLQTKILVAITEKLEIPYEEIEAIEVLDDEDAKHDRAVVPGDAQEHRHISAKKGGDAKVLEYLIAPLSFIATFLIVYLLLIFATN